MDKSRFFGSAGIQPRDVKFADGTTQVVHFRKVGSLERTRFIAAHRSGDPELIAAGFMRLVMFSVCEADGSQALTWDEVKAIDEEVYDQFVGHAFALNSTVEKKNLSQHTRDWFWHVLSLALGGRTVAEWQTVMTEDEFEQWLEFYRLHPFDDLHRYHRPAALVSVSLGGGKVEEQLAWLAPEPLPDGMTQADVNTLKAFGLTPPKRGE